MNRQSSGLLEWIDSQPPFLGRDWFASLDERKREEAEFHDEDRADQRNNREESSPNRRFYAAAKPLRDAIEKWIVTNSPGRAFLDYACGDGAQTIRAARAGAHIAVGIDISEVSIRNAKAAARAAGVEPTARFLQRDCENTTLPDSAFDACLCSGMLHHLDLEKAFPELARLMKPGGRILCVEALSYNPFIQLYRELTPGLRTPWEKRHILSLREVKFARRWFEVADTRFYNMLAPLATLLPNGVLREGGLHLGHSIDWLLTRIPGVRLWSWVFSFELVKPAR